MRRTRASPSLALTLLAGVLALGSEARAVEDLEIPDQPASVADVATPPPADDDRVWEDVSFGTGEADFTALAIDPVNPRRLFVGAGGSVYRSDDAGVTWNRVLDARGGAQPAEGFSRSREAGDAESEFDDRFQELREEAIEEARREIVDELVAELGDAGERLAEELAEELAEQRIDEEEDRLREEALQDIRRRNARNAPAGQPAGPAPQFANQATVNASRRVQRLVVLPGGRVLAATGAGLYVSKDGGETFEHAALGFGSDDTLVLSVAAHPQRPDVVFAGTRTGLFLSTDGGNSWAGVGDLPVRTEVVDLVVHPKHPEQLLAATSNGVYRTTDQGRTFVPVLQPSSSLARDVRAVAYDPVDPRIAFAGTQEGLFRSLDGGFAWERIDAPGLLNRQVNDLASAEWGLAVATMNGVFLSADAGASFRELFAGLQERDVRQLASGVEPLQLWGATGRGAFSYRPPVAREKRLQAEADVRALVMREPTIGEVSRSALRAAWMDDPPSSMRDRARWASLAPRLTIRYGALNPWGDPFVARDVFPTPLPGSTTLPDPVLYDTRNRTDALQALLVWDASRWLFDGRSIDVSSTFRRVQNARQRVLRRVVSLYDARRRLQMSLILSPPGDLHTLSFKTIQVEELTSVLDGLTNGYFSAALSLADQAPAPAGAPARKP